MYGVRFTGIMYLFQNQCRHMAFIEQEANEKTEAVDVKVKEESNIEKGRLVRRQKTVEIHGKKEKQSDSQKKIHLSNSFNTGRLMCIKAREDQIRHVLEETKANSSKSSSDQTRNQPVPSRGRKAVQDVSNHKITEYFPVRRSSRKTGKQIEVEEMDALRNAVYNGTNEKLLEVYIDEYKGRGIRAGRAFVKSEFVIEYKGDMMDYASAKKREEEYSKDPSIGSYMYFFKHKNKRWCVDATKESVYKGRLINHSALRPNLKTKVVEFEGVHHLILVAKRDIDEAEELLYDYGDRTPETVAKNPWLVNS